MAFNVKVKGLSQVQKELNAQIRKVRGGVRRGLLKAGIVIKGASIRNVPVDTGNLRASHYLYWRGGSIEVPTFTSGDGRSGSTPDVQKLNASANAELAQAQADIDSDFTVRVGASAHYAIFVHEAAPSTQFVVGGPKFLQRAISDNQSAILQIVQNEVSL